MAEQGGAAVRVLLLARAGEARQRLEQALAQAGAELVQVIDPAEGDPEAALALRPAAVLVALEPAVEDALERFDDLLSDPAVLVMFDEAEVAAQRDGWDAARWVRHLAAKLHGHQDVLPPGAEPGDAAVGAGDAVPVAAGGFSGLVSAEDMDWSASAGGYEGASPDEDPALAELLASSAAARAAAGLERDDAAKAGGGDLAPLDADGFAAVPADSEVDGATPAAEAPDAGHPAGWDLADPDAEPAGAAAGDTPAAAPLTLGEGLSLADDDGPIGVRDTSDAIDLAALESRLSGLSLLDMEAYGHGPVRGAVLVEAGLGGPDAVRQLLGGLRDDFPRPVLVRLQLDGGRYERLVQQMQRATTLPVVLAAEGAAAEAGTVYFLQPGTTLVVERGSLHFAGDTGTGGAYDALPAADSALLFLSGADASRVDAAMARAGEGALLLAQSPDTCYDGSAAVALVALGAVTAEPGDLAQALLDFWH